jgi:NAD(P)-dependent dehydrogenase (short-subunit alcohol dehydrogenase family)
MSVHQKVAVVTGASRGIGAGLVKPLLAVPSALAALSKGGLNAAIRSLAIEYAGKGIRVNAVSAGIIKTPMHPVETHDFFAPLHPMRRMGTIDEIVEAVLYLDTAHTS